MGRGRRPPRAGTARGRSADPTRALVPSGALQHGPTVNHRVPHATALAVTTSGAGGGARTAGVRRVAPGTRPRDAA